MDSIPSLVETLRRELQPWRAYVVAIDGRDGVGKSPLGRKLAFELKVPLVETDLFLIPGRDEPQYRLGCLSDVVHSRLGHDRPVMVEGICVLWLLRKIGVTPNFVVHVNSEESQGSYVWAEQFSRYELEFNPDQADHQVTWQSNDELPVG